MGGAPSTGGSASTGGTTASDRTISAIAAGEYHTCAVVNDGVQCWGKNDCGQLGNGSTDYESPVPVQVQGLTAGVTAIAASAYRTCAVVNGGVQCWGKNDCGQLGNGSTYYESPVPVQVQGLTAGVTSAAAGRYHTCALVNGRVQCWGHNGYGQLGDNSTTNSLVPVQVQFP